MYYSKAISKDQYNLDTLKYESQMGLIISKLDQNIVQNLNQKNRI